MIAGSSCTFGLLASQKLPDFQDLLLQRPNLIQDRDKIPILFLKAFGLLSESWAGIADPRRGQLSQVRRDRTAISLLEGMTSLGKEFSCLLSGLEVLLLDFCRGLFDIFQAGLCLLDLDLAELPLKQLDASINGLCFLSGALSVRNYLDNPREVFIFLAECLPIY